jgi:hypothetical protein
MIKINISSLEELNNEINNGLFEKIKLTEKDLIAIINILINNDVNDISPYKKSFKTTR